MQIVSIKNGKGKRLNTILMVIPSSKESLLSDSPFTQYTLNSETDWFSVTPCIITLKDGICQSVEIP